MIELMRALNDGLIDWKVWAGQHKNLMLIEMARDQRFAKHIRSQCSTVKSNRLLSTLSNEIRFGDAVRASRPTIVHRTYYSPLNLIPHGISVVETMHDLWTEQSDRGGLDTLKSWIKRRAIARADAVVCVSESTRRSLVDIWPWAESRSRVIHHGVRPLSLTPELPKFDRPFFLFVGKRDLYKDFDVVVTALARAQLSDHLLVAFGGGEFTPIETVAIANAGMAERVIHRTGGDAILAGLYTAATALVYPSRYEGFGLPLLEAMIHDCPVIAAPADALVEVGGEAVLFAPIGEADAWAAIMETVSRDSALTSRLRAAGRLRATEFSWQRSADLHSELYRELS